MKDLLAAERYAKALFEIVIPLLMDREIEAELIAFSEALKSAPEIEKFLSNPYFKLEEKKNLLERTYSKQTILLNFFTLLLEKNRFDLIHEIAIRFKKIADAFQGEGTVEIKTAVALDAKFEQAIVTRLEKIAGYKITVKKEVDPSLLGGVIVKIENKVLDGSVKSKIENLKKELIKIRTL